MTPAAPDTHDLLIDLQHAVETVMIALTKHMRGERIMLVLKGAPGVGRTMLARRIPGLMPPLTDHERRWLTAEYEAMWPRPDIRERPFRAPHHTVSQAALAGHSRGIRAGEVDLARFGVLFLDEIHEFERTALQMLLFRHLAMRGAPLLVASALPCPCGFRWDLSRKCPCGEGPRKRFDKITRDRIARLRCEVVTINMPTPNRRPSATAPRCPSSDYYRNVFWR
jgi:magnesium chelatase family protein